MFLLFFIIQISIFCLLYFPTQTVHVGKWSLVTYVCATPFLVSLFGPDIVAEAYV